MNLQDAKTRHLLVRALARVMRGYVLICRPGLLVWLSFRWPFLHVRKGRRTKI
jgi:hypothetical protein